MAMEVKIENKDGKMVYRDGIYSLENGDDGIWLFPESESATVGDRLGDIFSGDAEHFPDAEIKIVAIGEGESIKAMEDKQWEDQEKMIEYQWENQDSRGGGAWEGINSLEEAKSTFKRMTFGEEAEESSDRE